ncbi:MAG: PqqD family protein [Nitrospinae bacterium]|nr:PqqD family protein [Nitrospinota bacterium]
MQKLKDLAISETGLVFDPTSGHILTANPTGVFIINGLREGKSAEEIKTALLAEFDAEGENVERDVSEFMSQLAALELIKNG